ncbi:ShlB/FhaC/HecB family hemolysin secretion/activation protein [Bacterioplanoides pacificum]|uniref:ShlB/FhaC/HecB family hemolysin secretion/activation protein n=1 Tax=Bacterioplanoides pacificum TaxID=1171596 RepID=A0ABV7VSF1_9GAMM
MKTLCCSLLFTVVLTSPYSYAEKASRYFSDEESVRYRQPEEVSNEQRDNRFDREPRLKITHFDIGSLETSAAYNLDAGELNDIIETARKNKKSLFTIADLDDLVADLTSYYRRKGLLLARVYVPQQRIYKQTLVLGFAPGTLEAINIHGNEHYSNEVISRPFKTLITKPVQASTLEAASQQLMHYPGYNATTAFSAGEQPGSTQINISTQKEESFIAQLGFDNYGSRYTGRYRPSLTGYINNPTGNADQLVLGAAITLDPSNSAYGNILYRVPISAGLTDKSWLNFLSPITRYGMIAELGYTQSSYSVGQELEQLDISGEAGTYFAGLSSNLIFSSRQHLTAGLRLNSKTANTVQNGQTQASDKITSLVAQSRWQIRDEIITGQPGRSQLLFEYHHGLNKVLGSMENGDANSRVNAKGEYAPASFSKYILSLRRQQTINTNELLLALKYLNSPDMLTAIEQTALGGPYAVRGYQSGDFLADSALLLSAEYSGYSSARLSLPIDQLKAGVFYDYGAGWRNDALANENDVAHLSAVGWFADFVKEKKFNTRLMMGIPLSDLKTSDNSSYQFYLSFQRKL